MKLDKPLNLTFSETAHSSAEKELQADSDKDVLQLEALKKELQGKNQQIEALKRENSDLKTRNRELQIKNEETQERQKLMDEELRKAESQMERIMKLMNENQEQNK